MAIPMTGLGGLFTRLGKIGNLIKLLRNYQASQLTATTDTTTGIVAQFDAESDIQAIMGSGYIGLLNSSGSNVGSIAQQLAVATVNRMVFRDNPLLNLTLQQQNTQDAIVEIIRQMNDQGATILAMSITATPTSFEGTGNGVVVASTKRASDGLVLENSLSESVRIEVTSDSYSGTATEGNESVSISGVGANDDPFSFNWPLGSNATNQLSVIDGNTDAGNGNDLTNSGFEDWTNNEPDNWEVTVGAGGTNIFRESSIVYDGEFSMRITGDGSSTLTELRQQFASETDGTVTELLPSTQKACNIFARRGGVVVNTGVWEIALVDSNDDIIQDENGVDNYFTIDLTGTTVNFTAYNGVFRLPSILPDPIYLRMRLTTALPNGVSVYFDKLALGDMTQHYTSGPSYAVFAGSVPFQIGDLATCAVVNSRGSGGTLNTFQTLMDNLFGMRGFDLMLPSSGSPSISDALIG